MKGQGTEKHHPAVTCLLSGDKHVVVFLAPLPHEQNSESGKVEVALGVEAASLFPLRCFFFFLDFRGQTRRDTGGIFLLKSGGTLGAALTGTQLGFIFNSGSVCVCVKRRGGGLDYGAPGRKGHHTDVMLSMTLRQFSRPVWSRWSFIISQQTFGAFLCHAASYTRSTAGLVLGC